MADYRNDPVDSHGGGVRRAVVTGGAGFVGSTVVDLLLDRGCEVVVIDALSNGDKANLADACSRGAELHVIDIRDDCGLPRTEYNIGTGCEVDLLTLAGAVAAAADLAPPEFRPTFEGPRRRSDPLEYHRCGARQPRGLLSACLIGGRSTHLAAWTPARGNTASFTVDYSQEDTPSPKVRDEA